MKYTLNKIYDSVSKNGIITVTYTFRVMDENNAVEYSNSFDACSSPFHNCQNFSISNFVALLHALRKNIITKDDFIDIINIIKDNLSVSKPLLIVDINAQYSETVESVFEIHSKFEYTSTNNSEMIIYLLKTLNTN